MIKSRLVVNNRRGLHARAATKLANISNQYQCNIAVRNAESIVDAKSIISIMLLAASEGTVLIFEFDGADEVKASNAVAELFDNSFDEDE